MMTVKALTRIIHERFYCNVYSLLGQACTRFPWCAGGRARHSDPQHTVSNMLRALASPRARLTTRFHDFV